MVVHWRSVVRNPWRGSSVKSKLPWRVSMVVHWRTRVNCCAILFPGFDIAQLQFLSFVQNTCNVKHPFYESFCRCASLLFTYPSSTHFVCDTRVALLLILWYRSVCISVKCVKSLPCYLLQIAHNEHCLFSTECRVKLGLRNSDVCRFGQLSVHPST